MPLSSVLTACWPRSRMAGDCVRHWPVGVGEVGRSVSRCSDAPQLAAPLGGVPRWEGFPEVNRGLVACLLGVLAGRMLAPVDAGGERDERAGQAVGAAGG